MIPILYEKTETAFVSNGLGRLRDCTECLVTEERNGVYEASFSYPTSGANFDLIQVGRIIGVTHDESGDIEPFDIVSYSKPIQGVVTFHCVHISYRLSYMTVTASSINSLSAAFTAFESAVPSMPFSFHTDKTSTGFVAGFDGLPHTVRSLMGGTEGSILDAYGGEYSFNNWQVYLHSARGQFRDFAVRYGVNMLDYNEDYDTQGTFSSCIPYWTDGTDKVIGDRVDSTGATITGHGECVPLNLSDKFENKPTKAQVEAEAAAYLSSNNPPVPKQTIKVNFARLQDMGYENLGNLMQCNLCDTIEVIFPDLNGQGTYKIVKTVYNVLLERYDSLELGKLSTTLAEALGVSQSSGSYSSGGGGGGGGNTFFYGTCSTAANVAAKTVTVDNSFVLTAGVRVAVYMTNTNSKANPTLNVNGTGAAAIMRYGSTAASTSAASSWNAGQMLCLTYNGTSWFIENWINTTYSSMTQAEMQTGTDTTGRLITAARLKEAIQYYAPAGAMNDYVTDQGTDGDWIYRKWNSGISECWATATTTAATNTSDGGGYVSASAVTPGDFPTGLFIATPNVQVTCNSGNVIGSVTSYANPSTTSAGSYKLYRVSSNTNTGTKTFNFYCIGKWK